MKALILAPLLLAPALAQPLRADANFSYYPSSILDKRGMRAWPFTLGSFEFRTGVQRYRLSGHILTAAYFSALCERAALERSPGFRKRALEGVTLWLDDALSLMVTLEGPNAYGNTVQTYWKCYSRIEGLDLLFKLRSL